MHSTNLQEGGRKEQYHMYMQYEIKQLKYLKINNKIS